MVTSADLAGTLGVDWSPFQAGLDAAFAYAEAWGTRAGAVLALKVTVDYSSLPGASAGLDAVTTGATQAAAAQTSASAAGQQLAASLGVLNTQAQAAGTGVAGLAGQTLSADAALEALSSRSAGAQASMAGFTGGVSAETAALQAATAEMAAMTGASEALSAAQASSAAASEASAAADAALVSAQLALAEAETAVSQGADLAAAASRNYATSLESADAQVLITTANLEANAAANEQAAAAMSQTESRSLSMGSNVGLLALGLGVAGGSVLKLGMDFQTSSAQIEGFAGVSQQEIGRVQDFIIGLARDTGASTKQIADGFYLASSAGLSVSAAMTVVSASTKLAVADQTDAKTVVDAVTSALNSYHLSAASTGQVLDTMTASVVAGKMHFSDYADQIGKVLPIAERAGVDLSQVGASVAEMTQKGLSSSSAFAALSGMLLSLEAPSKTTITELAQIGLSVDDVRQSIADKGLLQTLSDLNTRTGGQLDLLKDLFPRIQGLRGAIADLGQTGSDYNTVLAQTTDSYGRAATAQNAYADTGAAGVRRFAQTAVTDLTSVGSAITDVVGELGRLPAPVQQGVVAFGLMTAGTYGAVAAWNLLSGLGATVGQSLSALAGMFLATAAAEETEAGAAEAASVATASIIPGAGIIIGLLSAVGVGLYSWESSSNDAGAAQRKLQQDTDAATQSIEQQIAAMRQSGQSNSDIAGQLKQDLQREVDQYDLLKAAIDRERESAAADAVQKLQTALANEKVVTQTDAGIFAIIREGQARGETNVQIYSQIQANEHYFKSLEQIDPVLKTLSDQYNQLAPKIDATKVQLSAFDDLLAGTSKGTQDVAGAAVQAGQSFSTFLGDIQRGVTVVSGLTAQLDSNAGSAARTADATKVLQDAYSKANSSAQDRSVFEAQLADAISHTSDTQDQAKARYQTLKDMADNSVPSIKAYGESQLSVDSAVNILGADAAAAAIHHQELADKLGITEGKSRDLSNTFPTLISYLTDTATKATDAGNALLDALTKPTPAQLRLQAQLAAVQLQVSNLNVELANSSYAEKHIAELEKIVLTDQATGASASKLAQDQANLATAMAGVSPQAAQQGKALADQLFALDNQQKGLQASIDQQRAYGQSLAATATADIASANNTALTNDQKLQSWQTYQAKVAGINTGVHDDSVSKSTSTGRDTTTALTTSFAAGNPAILAAGGQNAASYDRGLMAGMDITKTDATNAAAQLAGAITMPDAFAAAGTSDGEAFGSALVASIRSALQNAAKTVQAGGATIAGIASAAGAPGGGYATGGTLPTSGRLSPGQIAAALLAAGATPQEATILTAIALGENGGNVGGTSAAVPGKAGGGAEGIFQFMPATAAGVGLSNPFDPNQAIPAALRLARQAGYSQWDAYDYDANYNQTPPGQGTFTQFLPEAQAAVAALGQAGSALTTAAADLSSGSTGGGPFGGSELPPSAPETLKQQAADANKAASFANQETNLGGTVDADVSKANAAIDQLQQHIDEVTETEIPPKFKALADTYVSTAQTAQSEWQRVADDAGALNAAMADGAGKAQVDSLNAQLDADTRRATADQSAADKSYSAWHTVAGELAKDQSAAGADADKMSAALDTLGQHSADVASGQQQHALALGDAYTTAAATTTGAWSRVDTDITALNQAMANGADDATLQSLRTTLDADERKAESATKASDTAYARWHSSYQEMDSDLKAISSDSDKAGSQLAAMADRNAEVAGREAQHATGLATAYQDAAAKAGASWSKVLTDIANLQAAVAAGASTFQLQQLRTTLEVDAGIAADQSKTADTTYQKWKTTEDLIDAAWKQLQSDTRTGSQESLGLLNQLAQAGAGLGLVLQGLPSTVDQLRGEIQSARDAMGGLGTTGSGALTAIGQAGQSATQTLAGGFDQLSAVTQHTDGSLTILGDRVATVAHDGAQVFRDAYFDMSTSGQVWWSGWNGLLIQMDAKTRTVTSSMASYVDGTYAMWTTASRKTLGTDVLNDLTRFEVAAGQAGHDGGAAMIKQFLPAFQGALNAANPDVAVKALVDKLIGPAQTGGARAGTGWVQSYSNAFAAAFGPAAAGQAAQLLGVATDAVQTYQAADTQMLAIDQQLTDPGLTTEQRRRLQDQRTTLSQGVDLAKQAAKDSLTAYQQYVDGVKQANQALLSDRAGEFDDEEKMRNLSYAEQRAGVGGALGVELQYYHELDQLEAQLTQTTDANVQARLKAQIDADQFLLSQAKETTRELEQLAADWAKATQAAGNEVTDVVSNVTRAYVALFMVTEQINQGLGDVASLLGHGESKAQYAQRYGVSLPAASGGAPGGSNAPGGGYGMTTFALGGPVPQDMLAFVHGGEYVVPPGALADALRTGMVPPVAAPNAPGGGSTSFGPVHLPITVNALPGQSPTDIAREVRRQVQELFTGQLRRGQLLADTRGG